MTRSTNSHFTRITLAFFLVLLLAVATVSAWMVLPYLLSLVVGGLLAVLTKPAFVALTARKVSPKVAAFIVSGCVTLLVLLPIGLLASLAIQQGIAIGKFLAETKTYSLGSVIQRISHWTPIAMLGWTPQELTAKIYGAIQSAGASATSLLLATVADLPRIGLQLVMAVIAYFYFLVDGNAFLKWMDRRIFLDDDVQKQVVSSFHNMATASIWATLATGAAQSAVILFTFVILDVPGTFLAAGATFVFAWIPMLGSTPVWLTGAIYLYANDSIGKAIAMIVLGLFAGIIDNIIRPLVLKGRSNMHPLISLLAIFGGIELFGILGVFVGPILVAVLIALLQIWPVVAKRFGLTGAGSSESP